jgi:hypothetical protein
MLCSRVALFTCPFPFFPLTMGSSPVTPLMCPFVNIPFTFTVDREQSLHQKDRNGPGQDIILIENHLA